MAATPDPLGTPEQYEQAANEATPPVQRRGGSGRLHARGFLDYDEINAELAGKAGIRAFDKMWRTDADCRRVVTMCVAPIVAGTWIVEPFHDKDQEPTAQDLEIAAFVEWSLFEAMRPKLTSHLWTALTVSARAGFAPFEQVYRRAKWNGRDVFTIDTLDLRLPRSVDRWVQNGPRLVGVEQFVSGGGQIADWGRSQIPAADMVYYRFGAEGDNWEGQSLLRPAYKHWKYKDGLELIDVMGHERSHIGVPTGYPAPDADPDQLDEFEAFLENVRASDVGYYLAPGPRADHASTPDGTTGWFWEFVTVQQGAGAATGLQESIKHHRASIDSAIIAEFMRLGQAGTGARATADVQQDPFWLLIQTLARIGGSDPINEQLIPRLVGFNYSTDRMPEIKCSLIDSTTLHELGDYVLALSQAGVLRPEPRLEAYLRERAELPEPDEGAIADEAAKAAEQAAKIAETTKPKPGDPPPDDTKPPAPDDKAPAKTLGRQTRELRPWERTMSLDRIEGAIDGARQRFQDAAGDHCRTLAADLADQAARGRTLRHSAPPAELVSALHDELGSLYSTGRDTVREELGRQRMGGLLDPHTTVLDARTPASLLERARAAADAIRAAIIGALNRARLHQGVDRAVLHQAAEQAATGALRAQAQDHAAPALNLGRSDEADARSGEIAGAYYTAVLDGNLCMDCRRADDDVLRPLDSPIRLARKPPNRECLGGGRCRCMEAFVLDDESPAAA